MGQIVAMQKLLKKVGVFKSLKKALRKGQLALLHAEMHPIKADLLAIMTAKMSLAGRQNQDLPSLQMIVPLFLLNIHLALHHIHDLVILPHTVGMTPCPIGAEQAGIVKSDLGMTQFVHIVFSYLISFF